LPMVVMSLEVAGLAFAIIAMPYLAGLAYGGEFETPPPSGPD
jgi:hypothetical protein